MSRALTPDPGPENVPEHKSVDYGGGPQVANTASGSLIGVVQAGSIYGDVHLHHHNAQAPDVVVVATRLIPTTTNNQLFVGRQDETARILAALIPYDGTSVPSVVVSVVAGMGGVGKTALVHHTALLAARYDWFPGGVFWVDLQGYSPDGAVPAAAVFSPLLHHLGVLEERIPSKASDQAAVYHRILADLDVAGRAVLLVLDNAATTDQLDGLLPVGGRHRTLVTTRDTLALHNARRLPLDVLTEHDALALLDRGLRDQDADDHRIDNDPVGAARLSEMCGYLPLALLIVAGLLADEPHLQPHVLADQLGHGDIGAFTHGETRLNRVFTTSLERLHRRDPQAVRLLHLLALAPGIDINTEAAAALADTRLDRTRTRLRTLCQAHLLTTTRPDRWRMHDLIRRHATDNRDPHDHDDQAAITRLLDHYLHTTRAADTCQRALPGQPVSDRFTGSADARAWLDTEHPNIIAAVRLASATGHHAHTTHLAAALDRHLHWPWNTTDRLAINEHALAAARHLANPETLAHTWSRLGSALHDVHRFDEAITAYQAARDLYHDVGDHHSEATAWNDLGAALHAARRYDEALTARQKYLDICRELGRRSKRNYRPSS